MTEAAACEYIQGIINNQQKDISQRACAMGVSKRDGWTVRPRKVQLHSDTAFGTRPLNHSPR